MSKVDPFTRARSLLGLSDPYFSTIAYSLEGIKAKPGDVPGLWLVGTDGKRLWYVPEGLEKLTARQLLRAMAHEMLHIVFRHHTRRGHREHMKWNLAGDHVIENMLDELNEEYQKAHNTPLYEKIPGAIEADPKYRGMITEEVYNLLPDMPCNCSNKPGKGEKGSQPCPQHGHRCFHDAGKTQEEIEKADMEADQISQQAEQVAKMRGKMAANLQKIIDRIRKTRVDYRSVLPEFIQTSFSRDDVNWLKPVKRLFGAGVYMPKLHSPKIGYIAVARDTSGSCWSEDIQAQFAGEIEGVYMQMHPEKILLIDCDAGIHEPVLEMTEDNFPLPGPPQMQGGGGTSFKPPFNYLNELEEPPVCLIYLTDLEGDFPDKEPSYPVLWVVYGAHEHHKPPFGTVAYVKE